MLSTKICFHLIFLTFGIEGHFLASSICMSKLLNLAEIMMETEIPYATPLSPCQTLKYYISCRTHGSKIGLWRKINIFVVGFSRFLSHCARLLEISTLISSVVNKNQSYSMFNFSKLIFQGCPSLLSFFIHWINLDGSFIL